MLARDRAFWIALAVLVAAALPHVLPFMDESRVWAWRWQFGDITIASVTFLAAVVGVSRVRAKAERRFWRLVGFAYGMALLAELASAPLIAPGRQPSLELAVEALFLMFVLALFLAAGVRPDFGGGAGWRLDRLRVAGLGGLAVGLAIYFQAVPSAVFPNTVEAWYPNLYLFALLDVVVCVAFIRARKEQDDPRWRRILAGMAVVAAMYAILDAAEGTLYLETFADAQVPLAWDIAWLAPHFMFLGVARLHLGDPLHSHPPGGRRYLLRPDRGSLVAGLTVLPLLHVLLYSAGILDPALRDARDGVVAVYLLGMGILALVYLWTLERERERGGRELTLSEERYRSFVTSRSDRMYRAEANPPVRLSQPREQLISEIESRLLIAEADEMHGPAVGAPSVSDPTESIGRPLVEVLGPDLPQARRILQEWVEKDFDVDGIELREETLDGRPRYHRYSVIGIIDDDRLVRAWTTVSDVTEQRVAALETERLEQELEQAHKMESIGTFAGGIAHDFNNLLLPIIGFTEIAIADARPEDAAARESLSQVLRASHRAADLVRQVLSLSRNQPRREVPVHMQDVIREALGLIRPGLPSTVKIETSIDDACPPILGDPSRIHQVLLNLCANAAHAIGSDHGRIRIDLTHDVRREPSAPLGSVVLVVVDDGPGIAPEAVGRVFEPFFTTKDAGEGSGLGLAVVHGVVRSHRGSVSITSEDGTGTVVTIRLPATDRSTVPAVAEEAYPGPPLRVLLVDDEQAVTDVTELMLNASGHTVSSLSDSASALSAIRAGTGNFDLLLTDYTMLGMTGLELARVAREHDPALRVVIMSGFRLHSVDPEHEFVHLAKPFTSAELAATLRRATAVQPTS